MAAAQLGALMLRYLELTKPRVVLVMLFTVLIGMLLAAPHWNLALLPPMLWGLAGIGMVAGAAGAINHIVDRRVDPLMRRTAGRPLPRGELRAGQAAVFAAVLGVLGSAVLWVMANPLCMVLTLASLVGYAFVYSVYLKRATPQNIVIGGLAGAMPPLLGWTAVSGRVDAEALLLVLIIFVWTPPHFWVLALSRCDEYRRAGIPMLPATHGAAYTRVQILLYTILLLLATMLPWVVGMFGALYLAGAVALGVVYLGWSLALLWRDSEGLRRSSFNYSIVYILALFAMMLADRWL